MEQSIEVRVHDLEDSKCAVTVTLVHSTLLVFTPEGIRFIYTFQEKFMNDQGVDFPARFVQLWIIGWCKRVLCWLIWQGHAMEKKKK